MPLIGRFPLLLYHVYIMVLKSFIHSIQALILMTNIYENRLDIGSLSQYDGTWCLWSRTPSPPYTVHGSFLQRTKDLLFITSQKVHTRYTCRFRDNIRTKLKKQNHTHNTHYVTGQSIQQVLTLKTSLPKGSPSNVRSKKHLSSRPLSFGMSSITKMGGASTTNPCASAHYA